MKRKKKRRKVTIKARIMKACAPYVTEVHKLRQELNRLKFGD